jgi:hypothetical protein
VSVSVTITAASAAAGDRAPVCVAVLMSLAARESWWCRRVRILMVIR